MNFPSPAFWAREMFFSKIIILFLTNARMCSIISIILYESFEENAIRFIGKRGRKSMNAKTMTAACVFVTAAMSLSTCVATRQQTVKDINDNSTFAIKLLTHVDDIDFTAYEEVPGLGVTGYYDKKYQTQDGTPVEECYVLYSVTMYPDHGIGHKCVTSIYVTDPDVVVYGYSVGDSAAEVQTYLQEEGFSLEEDGDTVKRFQKAHVTIRVGVDTETSTVDSIGVETDITNYFGVTF